MLNTMGLIAAVVLPLWNIPLIVRIGQRRSSQDISLPWTFGVFISLLFMLPSALMSSDVIFKVFAVVNIVLFGAVVIQVLRFRS